MVNVNSINNLLNNQSLKLSSSDEKYTFEFQALALSYDFEKWFFKNLPAGHNWQITKVISKIEFIKLNLLKWLSHDHLALNIIAKLNSEIAIDAFVYEIILDAKDGKFLTPWYEGAWNDFLLISNNEQYFLHLGVSD